ncbi:MAG: cupin domain-containing protein [Alphaproteobacteria bacterium]|nr:cupin domain-containing protein [Alphaproteobacteria bacterium]
MAKKKANTDGYKRAFVALHDHEVAWEDGAENNLLTLPPGIKVKILNHDPVMGRVDMKVKFPPGYVEPEHAHQSWHAIVVLEGRMCVAGKDLRPGDYVFGWDELHGPYEYPDGCEVFVVFMGEGTEHQWSDEQFAAHENKWEAETQAGRDGVEAFKRGRG